MNQEDIFKKYPKLFRQKDLSKTETCMCWGITVGAGWLPIIDVLCGMIQLYCDVHPEVQIEATQVKEKYGSLRFYFEPYNKRIEHWVEMAEALSARTCEECGSMKSAKINDSGYLSCRCPACRDKGV